jgi:hypothetical protein
MCTIDENSQMQDHWPYFNMSTPPSLDFPHHHGIANPKSNYIYIYLYLLITLFISITMFRGTRNILWNIPHIQYECEKYSVKYCQSHKTLLWI